jgi:aminoglycoside phosphotransferase (APT) family kinase protein
MDLVDRATTVREGESVNSKALDAYLKEALPDLKGPLAIKQYPGGYSNLTYLILKGENKLVLRRPPPGTKAQSAHDMGREFNILSALNPAFPYCPKPIAYCKDNILDQPFYLMEALEGIIIRRDYPEGINLTEKSIAHQGVVLMEVLCELHNLDYKALGLGQFGRPEGYTHRQVTGWSQRYQKSYTPDAASFDKVMTWLSDHEPIPPDRHTIIHNDYKLDNVLWDKSHPDKLIGVLDWEMATIGNPLMDLGNSLAYWVQSDDPPFLQEIRMLPTNTKGCLRRKELLKIYEERTNQVVENFLYYHTFGLFRLAVIVQQIYYRYYHKQTRDLRFAKMVYTAKALEKACLSQIA